MDNIKLNSQELFWKTEVAEAYLRDNYSWDTSLGMKAWEKILSKVELHGLNSICDLGSNKGRNIGFLKQIIPLINFTAFDINDEALKLLKNNFPDVETYCSRLKDIKHIDAFDLVFTSQVLIHIPPEDLDRVLSSMFHMSKRYILLIEYFNRTPVEINYRGRNGVLFKLDFGSRFVDLFNVKCVDYGFLWGREYDRAGFDDVTFWLFDKLA
jgi:pseudaminic acid biosynthesis-associated methylase